MKIVIFALLIFATMHHFVAFFGSGVSLLSIWQADVDQKMSMVPAIATFSLISAVLDCCIFVGAIRQKTASSRTILGSAAWLAAWLQVIGGLVFVLCSVMECSADLFIKEYLSAFLITEVIVFLYPALLFALGQRNTVR